MLLYLILLKRVRCNAILFLQQFNEKQRNNHLKNSEASLNNNEKGNPDAWRTVDPGKGWGQSAGMCPETNNRGEEGWGQGERLKQTMKTQPKPWSKERI